jgi:hypothetical protein
MFFLSPKALEKRMNPWKAASFEVEYPAFAGIRQQKIVKKSGKGIRFKTPRRGLGKKVVPAAIPFQ